MPRTGTLAATTLAVLLALSLVTTVTVFGAGVAGANHPDDAPDLTEFADFRVNFPHATDHYPGDQNEENGSIEYFASGAAAFDEQDAEEGVFIDWVIVHAEYEGEDWIDYSACDTDNTEAFGIDRGNNNSGVQYDDDLVSRQKKVNFRDDGIVINFYNWEDFGGDPPYLAPEDAVVAAQGEGSAGGPCLTLTDEPGWYRIAAFLNATVADNGRNEQPSGDADRVSLELNSNNYLYVCECDSRAEAEEQLGPPPNEKQTPTETETNEDTPEPTETDSGGDTPDPTETDSGGETPEPTETDSGGGDDTPEPTATDSGGGDDTPAETDDDAGDESDEDVQGTPTPGEGPGFGALTALVGLLAAALFVFRRD